MQRFKFEELRVYQAAIEFMSCVFALTKSWPQLYKYSLVDQLHRAALSISLNIAEGSGRTSKDFQHFLSIARGSCYECVALFTVIKQEKLISEKEFDRIYDELDHLARMLTALKSRITTSK